MKIKLLSLYAGPSGTHLAGEVIERAQDEAMALIKGGYAVPVAEPAETATAAPAEQRDEEPAGDEESAEESRPTKRRGR